MVVTDTLPTAATFAGASPGCTYAAGRVTCQAGDMLPGSWYGFLINVGVPMTITNGTVVTNVVTAATRTQLLTATSVLTASEPTTWLQAAGSPTDLAITKVVTPAQVVAGGGAPITYTLTVTNNGPAPATAVQVTDLFPQPLQLLAIRTSLPVTQAQCSSGGVCDLGSLAVGQAAVITLVMQAPANAAARRLHQHGLCRQPGSRYQPRPTTAQACRRYDRAAGDPPGAQDCDAQSRRRRGRAVVRDLCHQHGSVQRHQRDGRPTRCPAALCRR